MTEREFYSEVEKKIEEYLPEELKNGEIEINEVPKNNDVVLHGLTVRMEDEAIAPNVYLEQYFEKYNEGEKLDAVMKEIAKDYEEANKSPRPELGKFDFSFDKVKDKLVFQVVDMDMNKSRLSKLAYRPIGNRLAMVYSVRVEAQTGDEGRILVTRDLLKQNDWDLIDVDRAAVENTPNQFKATLTNIGNEYFEMNDVNLLDEKVEGYIPEGMFILTNDKFINGSASLFYPGVQSKVAEIMGGDYFVLPSSIHETILLKDNGMHTANELGEMVKDANRTVVAPQEVLSDKVYHYNAEFKELTTVFGEKERVREEAR